MREQYIYGKVATIKERQNPKNALQKANTSSHSIIALQEITELETAGHGEAPSLYNYFSRNGAKNKQSLSVN